MRYVIIFSTVCIQNRQYHSNDCKEHPHKAVHCLQQRILDAFTVWQS